MHRTGLTGNVRNMFFLYLYIYQDYIEGKHYWSTLLVVMIHPLGDVDFKLFSPKTYICKYCCVVINIVDCGINEDNATGRWINTTHVHVYTVIRQSNNYSEY